MIMKTGATEIQDKLSTHLRTTLTCYPHYLIFSDYEEHLNSGQHILDALKYVSPSIKESHQDFDLWRRLRDNNGRAGLLPSELSGTNSTFKDEPVRVQIPGWKLDKWKFLPMVAQTLHHYPDKHWYVFVEADTYVFWSSLLPYLNALPWTDNYYIGAKTGHEDIIFAHGGSGFALSRSALEKVVLSFSSSQKEWEAFTDRYIAGDHILGAALTKAGVRLRPSSPSWQGEPVSHFDFQSDKGAWCQTAVSYHHESPSEIEDLWNFEQTWIAEAEKPSNISSTYLQEPKLLRHRDVFEKYVLPRTMQPRSNWNVDGTPKDSAATSLSECKAFCKQEPACLQYALHYGGECTTTTKLSLGEAAESVESGWMPERVQECFNDMEEC